MVPAGPGSYVHVLSQLEHLDGVPRLILGVTDLGGQAGRRRQDDRDAVSEYGRQEPGRCDEQAGDDGRHTEAEVGDQVDGGEQAPLPSAALSTRLTVSRTPARTSSSRAAFANGPAAATSSFIARSPGDRDAPATPSPASRGANPCPQAAQWYHARVRVTAPSTVSMTLSR